MSTVIKEALDREFLFLQERLDEISTEALEVNNDESDILYDINVIFTQAMEESFKRIEEASYAKTETE